MVSVYGECHMTSVIIRKAAGGCLNVNMSFWGTSWNDWCCHYSWEDSFHFYFFYFYFFHLIEFCDATFTARYVELTHTAWRALCRVNHFFIDPGFVHGGIVMLSLPKKTGSTISLYVGAWLPSPGNKNKNLFLFLPHILVWSHIPLLSSSGWCAGGGQPPSQQGGADPCDKASSSADSDGGASLPVNCWTRWRSYAAHLGIRTHTVQSTLLALCTPPHGLRSFFINVNSAEKSRGQLKERKVGVSCRDVRGWLALQNIQTDERLAGDFSVESTLWSGRTDWIHAQK